MKVTNALLLVTTIIIALWSVGFNNTNNNFVFLVGIGDSRAKNWNLVYKGLPWALMDENPSITDYLDSTYHFIKALCAMRYRKTEIFNARANNTLSFEQNGFTILKNQQIIDSLNVDQFKEYVINLCKKIFPNATSFKIPEGNVATTIRGPGNTKYAPFVHMDYAQSREGLTANSMFWKPYSELILSNNTIWVIGFWKPFQMNDVVCKDSLALMDGSTLNVETDIMTVHTDFVHRAGNGDIRYMSESVCLFYNPNQKWYYYPNMSTDEMIMFTHFRSDKIQPNAHVTFTPNHCDSNGESRMSIETRVLIQF